MYVMYARGNVVCCVDYGMDTSSLPSIPLG